MSHLSAIKAKAFTERLEVAKADPEFQSRQAAHAQEVAAVNSGLTNLLAERSKAKERLTTEDLARFPSPGESPAEELAREIHMEIQQ